jgi:hypothetical protein
MRTSNFRLVESAKWVHLGCRTYILGGLFWGGACFFVFFRKNGFLVNHGQDKTLTPICQQNRDPHICWKDPKLWNGSGRLCVPQETHFCGNSVIFLMDTKQKIITKHGETWPILTLKNPTCSDNSAANVGKHGLVKLGFSHAPPKNPFL